MPAVRPRPRARKPFNPEDFRAPLGEHLEDLRGRLIRVAVIILLGMTAGWFLQPWVYQTLSAVAQALIPKDVEYREVFRNVTDAFMLKLRLAFYIGLFLTLPLTVLQLWGFIAPGLKESERRPLRIVAPLSVGLFFLGTWFCWLILPSAFAWFLSYLPEFEGTAVYQEPGTLIFFIVKMLLSFGIGFQLPLIVFFLAKIGLITNESLKNSWRQYTVGIFTGAAILTPSNDLFSMMMMAVPLTLLFFLSMLAIKLTNKPGERDPALDELD